MLKSYFISADGGATFTRQWLTEQEAQQHRERYGWIVNERPIMWDTRRAVSDVLRRYNQIRQAQNPSTARDFLEEVVEELEDILLNQEADQASK